jgi:uncharacterized protein
MKYLVLLAVVLAVLWFLRNSRRGGPSRGPASDRTSDRASAASPQDMVECPVCLVHLPRSDALPGPDGQFYCCTEHRARAGD